MAVSSQVFFPSHSPPCVEQDGDQHKEKEQHTDALPPSNVGDPATITLLSLDTDKKDLLSVPWPSSRLHAPKLQHGSASSGSDPIMPVVKGLQASPLAEVESSTYVSAYEGFAQGLLDLHEF